MKPHLMHSSRDFEVPAPPSARSLQLAAAGAAGVPVRDPDLMRDLDLKLLIDAMSGGDPYLGAAARKALLEPLREPTEILYRQAVVADSLAMHAVVRAFYAIIVDAVAGEKKLWGGLTDRYPDGVLYRSITALSVLVPALRQLRWLAENHAKGFRSDGWQNLLRLLMDELNESYLFEIEMHADRLGRRSGILISAELGAGNQGWHYAMRLPRKERRGWLARFNAWTTSLVRNSKSPYHYQVAERDEAGARALSQLQNQGIAPVAAALGRATSHLVGFFGLLRSEVGFLVACLNLAEQLAAKGAPLCSPHPCSRASATLSARSLYDVCLQVSSPGQVVRNNLEAGGRSLIVVTGANGGGKSTFLRSVGQAMLMMHAGMFVPACEFHASVSDGLFTHFRRQEDIGLKSGKFDEELRRMSGIVDQLRPGSLLLLNESFASTNEREGSEVGRQVVRSLQACGVRLLYVTHLYALAQDLLREQRADDLFLRAERRSDGTRTFRIHEGEPSDTSHGVDLFNAIFNPPSANSEPTSTGSAGRTSAVHEVASCP